jgi:glycosyltransferase involved in cell wall biosynthesis
MPTTKPLVSVLVPVFNAEPYIRATLTSVIGQSYPHIEIIVVDDGSVDGTIAALEAFVERGVHVVHQPNRGACAARNRALVESRGALIQWLDGDDLLGLDKIEKQVALMEQAPTGCLAVCGAVYFTDGDDPRQGRFLSGYPALNSDDPVQWLLDLWTPGPGYGTTRWGMVPPCCWLVPRAVADRAGPWDVDIAQDQDGEYFTRVLLASEGVRWEPEGRAYYRQYTTPGSVSRGGSERHLRGRLLAVDAKVRHVMPRMAGHEQGQATAAFARQYTDIAFHAYPRYPALVREAEEKATMLGGAHTVFFSTSRLARVERALGWKLAKRLSRAYHRLTRSHAGGRR